MEEVKLNTNVRSVVISEKDGHKKIIFDKPLNKDGKVNGIVTIENQDTLETEKMIFDENGYLDGPYVKKDKNGNIIASITYNKNAKILSNI